MPTDHFLSSTEDPAVLIVDDEHHCIQTLQTMLRKIHPAWTRVRHADSVATAKQIIPEFQPDLVFLDVEMPYSNGFDLLTTLPEVSFAVIFTTAHENYAIKAIRFNALDYLLKPFTIQELDGAVGRYLAKRAAAPGGPTPAMTSFLSNLQQPASRPKKMALPTLNGLIFVPLENIVRCEASDNYSKVYTRDGTSHLVSKTLKELEYLLEDLQFFRVHYSHLINLEHMKKYVQGNGGYVLMTDGSTIEVSRRRKSDFLKKAALI